ncbi:MAG: PTS sugar transporter subunit IIB [Erysipelotrichaceae bacterium]
MIALVRCDERLIHGQCMQFIVSDYSIKRIIVVDDATASNALLKSIFTTAVPPTLTANVYSIDEAVNEIKGALSDNVSTLLLMKYPRVYETLLSKVSDLQMALNIGPQMARNGVKCVDYATLFPQDIEACKSLTNKGIRVYFNSIGANGNVVEWSAVEKKL